MTTHHKWKRSKSSIAQCSHRGVSNHVIAVSHGDFIRPCDGDRRRGSAMGVAACGASTALASGHAGTVNGAVVGPLYQVDA